MRSWSCCAAVSLAPALIGCSGKTAVDREAGPRGVRPVASGGAASGLGSGGAGGQGASAAAGGDEPQVVDCTGLPAPAPGPAPEWASGYLVSGYREPVPVQSGAIAALAAQRDETCAVEVNGNVWCWGFLSALQDGTRVAALIPTRQPALDGGLTASEHCATLSGEPVCFQTAERSELPRDCLLRPDRSVECDGSVVPELTNVLQIQIQGDYGCAIRAGGEVWCWGSNDYGQLGEPSADGSLPVRVPGLLDPVKLSLSRTQACVLLADGGVVCWGIWNPCLDSIECGDVPKAGFSPRRVPSFPPARDLAQGKGRICILTSADEVLCRTANHDGSIDGDFSVDHRDYSDHSVQLPLGSQLIAGDTQICAVAADAVFCWGGNLYGPVGDGTWQNEVRCPTSVLSW